jgi:hypothetical protein
MAIPSDKSVKLDAMFGMMTGKDRRKTIMSDTCIQCGDPATHFNDDLSRKEYTISGLCQRCQDDVWVPGGEE